MNKNPISIAESDRITNEINNELDRLIKGCATVDMNLVFEAFDNSKEFLMMGTDGTVVNYDNYKKGNVEYLLSCERLILSTKNKAIRIIDRNTAILAWSYSVDAKLKTGERDIIEGAGASFVFRRENSKWKVIYYHESSTPVKRLVNKNT